MNERIVVSVLVSFIISILLYPLIIPFLQKLKFSQYIRKEGPKSHMKKEGTPTMGGLVILTSVVITSYIYTSDFKETIPILFTTLGFGLIGFFDDYIKVVLKRNLGLTPIEKIILECIVTFVFIYYIKDKGYGTDIIVPFMNGMTIDIGYLYVPMVIVAMLGTVNGANFTDGLDGLATGVTIIITIFFMVVSNATDEQITPMTGSVLGSLSGFFLFNVYPARLFMGDTGSLALGGFVSSTAIILKMPLFLLIVGIIYFIEIVSVMLQIAYYKLTHGKRLFKMAPIHHHLEMSGWPETRIVATMSTLTAMFCLIAYRAM